MQALDLDVLQQWLAWQQAGRRAWLVTVAICSLLVWKGGVQIFFVSLPGWFVACLLYLLLSKFLQKHHTSAMAASTPA